MLTVTTPQNTPSALTLAATDFNVNDVLTYSVASPPLHGAINGTAPSLTYTPDANYSGSDSFNFVANDGDKNSNTATVTINVTTATPTPSPQERARAAFDAIAKGTFDRTQLTPALAAELTAARLAGYARVLGPLGAPSSFALVGSHDIEGTTTSDYVVRYNDGAVAFAYGIDDTTQRVSKLYVRTTRS